MADPGIQQCQINIDNSSNNFDADHHTRVATVQVCRELMQGGPL